MKHFVFLSVNEGNIAWRCIEFLLVFSQAPVYAWMYEYMELVSTTTLNQPYEVYY